MRTIPAVDVVTGMTVRIEQRHSGPNGETVETIEGQVYGTANANIQFGNGVTKYLSYDHPVTVLAEPEPEWVVGAWYRCRVHITSDGVKTLRRCVNGWTSFEQGTPSYGDDQVTVLGRVLIVDWPGGDVDYFVRCAEQGLGSLRAAELLADAIRTQGGVR